MTFVVLLRMWNFVFSVFGFHTRVSRQLAMVSQDYSVLSDACYFFFAELKYVSQAGLQACTRLIPAPVPIKHLLHILS